MRKILIAVCLLAHTLLYAQHKVEIYGKILSADNQPAAGITVNIKGVGKSSYTDGKGNYTFNDVDTGGYVLAISAVGIKPLSREIYIRPGGRMSVPTIYLTENRASLEEINIYGIRNTYT